MGPPGRSERWGGVGGHLGAPHVYDTIGRGYDAHRRPDPRIAAAIADALGAAASVVNVGAGAGSYEPADRPVVAVEPSAAMLRQRRPGTAPPAICRSATRRSAPPSPCSPCTTGPIARAGSASWRASRASAW